MKDFVNVCACVCRPAPGGQPVHQGHHSGSRSHPGWNQKRRSSGDRQDRTHDPAGAGMFEVEFKHLNTTKLSPFGHP